MQRTAYTDALRAAALYNLRASAVRTAEGNLARAVTASMRHAVGSPEHARACAAEAHRVTSLATARAALARASLALDAAMTAYMANS